MKSTIASLLVLAVSTFAAGARLMSCPSYEVLDKKSDIIVVATPVSTKDTDEKTILPNISPDIHVVGLSSEFETVVVLKGDKSLKTLVVHHYRLAHPKARMVDSPTFLASFEPKESTRYLLFLQREPDGRYAPFEQVDPASSSILKLRGSEWDQMSPDTFKNWMDAKRWLRERPINEAPDPGSGISPKITPEGRAEGSLHEAAMNGKLDKAKALIKANPDLVFSDASYGSLTPLQFAAEYGHKDVAELLLANKADVEAKSHGSLTPLEFAARYGHKDVAELLLANKAEVEGKSYGGWTPLLNAVSGGHKDLVELLLKNKANVNYQEEEGRSALYLAAASGYTEIAALLLANQADVNAKNRDGLTPLHVAVALGRKDMVELLLTNNADVNAKDNGSRTPLGFALLHKYQDLAKSLREHGGKE